jgi:hypothetical protein
MSQVPTYRSNSPSSDADDLVTKLGHAFERVVEKAAAAPATSREAWRAKAVMLSTVMRETDPDHPIAKMAQSLIRDIISG